MPFLTILTRVHPGRPKCLQGNIKSVLAQTDPDVEHLLLYPPDEKGMDVIKAGPLIHWAQPKVTGQYVMMLDDDDRLATPDFVHDLKALAKDANFDMVIFRSELGDWICPPDKYWNARAIVLSNIAGPCVVVKREIYELCSDQWLRPIYASDFFYIKAAFSFSRRVFWWDYIGTETQGTERNNRGKGEEFITFKGEQNDTKY